MAPPRKPIALRGLSNAQKSGYARALSPPDIEPEIPEPPEYLGPVAREMWDYLTPRLHQARVLNKTMKFSLLAMCETWAVYRDALEKEEWSKWDKALGRLQRFFHVFGLDPSGLAGLHVPAPDRSKATGKDRYFSK